MNLLLDTHIFLWYISGDDQLPEAFTRVIPSHFCRTVNGEHYGPLGGSNFSYPFGGRHGSVGFKRRQVWAERRRISCIPSFSRRQDASVCSRVNTARMYSTFGATTS